MNRFKDKPSLVFYVDATTASTTNGSLAAIAKVNGYENSGQAALDWMSSLDGPFFMYIDNADVHTMNLRDYFPRSTFARIVITTRRRETKQTYTTGPDSDIFLGPLSEVEATDLLIGIADLDSANSTVLKDVAALIQVRLRRMLICRMKHRSRTAHLRSCISILSLLCKLEPLSVRFSGQPAST